MISSAGPANKSSHHLQLPSRLEYSPEEVCNKRPLQIQARRPGLPALRLHDLVAGCLSRPGRSSPACGRPTASSSSWTALRSPSPASPVRSSRSPACPCSSSSRAGFSAPSSRASFCSSAAALQLRLYGSCSTAAALHLLLYGSCSKAFPEPL